MRARALTLLAFCALAACSGSSGSNPFGSLGSLGSLNPFGGREESSGDSASASTSRRAENDRTVLIERIETARPEPALRGLIIRVTGIASTQGYHSAELRPFNDGQPDERGIVTYEFRVLPPATLEPTGTERSRRILAAAFVHDDDLGAIRGFRILARENSVDFRR